MKWKKAEYPYSYNKNEKEYMDKIAIPNFEKFKEITGIDKIDVFNFGYDVNKVFNGENPRYNNNSTDSFGLPDHTNFYYRNSETGDTYLIGFPYSVSDCKDFCKNYNLVCVVFDEKYSFYHNKGTWMYVFGKIKVLQRLIDRIRYEENDLFFNGKLKKEDILGTENALWSVSGFNKNNENESRTIRGDIVYYVNNICVDLKIYRIERIGWEEK